MTEDLSFDVDSHQEDVLKRYFVCCHTVCTNIDIAISDKRKERILLIINIFKSNQFKCMNFANLVGKIQAYIGIVGILTGKRW